MEYQYPNSLQALEKDLANAKDSEITKLAIELIERAKQYDIMSTYDLQTYPQYIINGEVITRNRQNPVEYTHQSVLGAPGSDNIDRPIRAGEEWNKGRRATSTSAIYTIGKDGRPINPYFPEGTGITGQGLLWQYGPNHAIDNGFITIENDKDRIPTLYTIGINRKDSPDKASFSGGFVKFEKDEKGLYIINDKALINSKAEEFFEEMLSGSVTLRYEYEVLFPRMFGNAIMKRMENRTEAISREKLEVIEEQIKTELKMEQTEHDFPDFFPRLRTVFARAKECFSGPILNAGRSTDNSWIESKLSWIFLSKERKKYIIGNTGLDFAAGDDAGKVRKFKIDSNLIKDSNVSHTAMFAFMTASFLLDSQHKHRDLHPHIIEQAQDISEQLKIENKILTKKFSL